MFFNFTNDVTAISRINSHPKGRPWPALTTLHLLLHMRSIENISMSDTLI